MSTGAPTRGEAAVHIRTSAQRVYDLVSDVTRMGEWSPETYRCEWRDGVRTAVVGARFKAWNRRRRMRWTNTPVVVAAEPPREFAFRRTTLGSKVDWRYRIAPTAGGCEVTESFEVVTPLPQAVNWVMGKLLGVRDRNADLSSGMRQTLERVRRAAEGHDDDRT